MELEWYFASIIAGAAVSPFSPIETMQHAKRQAVAYLFIGALLALADSEHVGLYTTMIFGCFTGHIAASAVKALMK